MTDKTVVEPANSDVENVKRNPFAPEDLRAISSYEDAVRLLTDSGVDVRDATTEIGDGFTMLDDKDMLVKIPMIILVWIFTKGDFGEDYCIMRVVTADGKKYVVTDGSTGLCTQLQEYTARTGSTGGLLAQRGLRKSEYFLGADNQPSLVDTGNGKGYTYYLNV